MSNNSSVGKLVTGHLKLSIDGDHDTQKLFKTKMLFISCEFVHLCRSGRRSPLFRFRIFFSLLMSEDEERKQFHKYVDQVHVCLLTTPGRYVKNNKRRNYASPLISDGWRDVICACILDPYKQ